MTKVSQLTVNVVGMFSENVLVEFLGAVVLVCDLTESCEVVADCH